MHLPSPRAAVALIAPAVSPTFLARPESSLMLNRILDHLEEWLIAFLMGAATLLIFVAVVHRYAAGAHYPSSLQFIQDFLLGINLGWAQELCIYMFIWLAKFGAA
jgi:C4-dicarboxylate transporter DctQ subunit